jgi:calcineurin-like phosphoesterase family protein
MVTKATLKLFTLQNPSPGFTVHGVNSNTWGETTTTYSNAPAIGPEVAASGSHPGKTYVSVDVTSLVTRSGLVSMALKRPTTAATNYNSREAASNPPQLIVETAPQTSGQTVVYALGDGADGSAQARDLANYINGQNPDRFFYLGDVYGTGTAAQFAANYDPLYGSMASKTDPVMGNHEYLNRSTGYYPYWQSKRGWTQAQADHRSYIDAASGWQIIAYSSEADAASEGNWVASEIAKRAGTCRIVIAHRGRHVVVDAAHNDQASQEPVWSKIIDKTAINLVAHNHIYGRLAPVSGVTVIVSGAGGHDLRTLGVQHHTVVATTTGTPTATRFVLRRGIADFQQVDRTGKVYDSGTVACTPVS